MRIHIHYLILVFMLLFTKADAQDGLSFTQFYNGVARYHPSLSGIDPFLDINVGYKQPWKGFGDNASTYYLSAFGQIRRGSKLDEGMRTFRISNPTVYDRLKQTKSIRRKHGVGFVVSTDKIDAFKNIEMKTYYAYHIPVTREFNLSMGSGVGLYQQQIDYSDLHVRDEINDNFYNQLLMQSTDTYSRFLMDFSLAFYSEKYYFALTGESLVDQPIGGSDLMVSLSKKADFKFLSGAKYDIGPNFVLHPNIGLAYNSTYGFRYLASFRAKYKDFIYSGLSWNDDLKISYLMGLKAINNIFIHYSYDFYRDYLKEYAQGTHEITISFRLLNKYGTSLVSW